MGSVDERVVAVDYGLWGDILRAFEGCRCLYRGDVPAEVAVEGFDNHGGAALFALEAVACDVWSSDESFLEELAIDIWLAFPTVEGDVALPSQQGFVVAHGPTCGVDDKPAALQAVEESLITQMPCGVITITCEWCVEGDDVAFAVESIDIY